MDVTTYFRNIAAWVNRSKKESAFVFIHGYNTTFEDAARRTTQITYDIRFKGAPVFYSWLSNGDPGDYICDEEDMRWSTTNLEKFLADFAQESQADQFFLIAHSMGARALTSAYVSLIHNYSALKEKFIEIILSAPDIVSDIFKRDIAPAIFAGTGKLTLYASSKDKALQLSSEMHGGYPRAGESGANLIVLEGMESIDLTSVRTDFLNHSYAVENRSVLSDIYHIVHNSLRAHERFGLEPVSTSFALNYWRFKR